MGAIFLVDEAIIEWLVIVLYGEGWACLGIACCWERSEELLYLLLVGGGVDISDDDDALQVGAVPRLIEGLDIGILEALEYVKATYDIAVCVL